MLVTQSYARSSTISNTGGRTTISFAPDLSREPTFFRGKMNDPIRYRDAMCALRDVVVSDLTFKPRDHTAYQEWVQQQYLLDIAQFSERKVEVADRIDTIRKRMNELNRRRQERMGDYWQAQMNYLNYLGKIDSRLRYVFDPVITVAPDQVFFEAFSVDESSYGRLAAHNELFSDVRDYQYGTTNIDFSEALYGELQRMRTYRPTDFEVDPSGFQVETEGREIYKEKKIDVPVSWIRGFLQVQSAMSMPAASFDLAPVDIFNICTFLRRHRERRSPRSLRYVLTPGEPVKLIIDPWGAEMTFGGSVYQGSEAQTIRTWGRRRLFLIERMLPMSKRIRVHLLGNGMPSFYVADLGSLSFTLGLSGWTRNDWAAAGNFDLMAGSSDVTPRHSTLVLAHLKMKQLAGVNELALLANLSPLITLAALRQLCAAGRVMYDLETGKYRIRELMREPLNLEQLKYANPREQEADEAIQQGKASLDSVTPLANGGVELKGKISAKSRTFEPSVVLDQDGRFSRAKCTCFFYKQNRLMQGPCEHMMALVLLNKERKR